MALPATSGLLELKSAVSALLPATGSTGLLGMVGAALRVQLKMTTADTKNRPANFFIYSGMVYAILTISG